MGAMNLVEEVAGKERKAGTGTTDDGQSMCTSTRERNGQIKVAFYMDKFKKVEKERARKKERAEAKVAGKRPSNGSVKAREKSDNGMFESTVPASRQCQRG